MKAIVYIRKAAGMMRTHPLRRDCLGWHGFFPPLFGGGFAVGAFQLHQLGDATAAIFIGAESRGEIALHQSTASQGPMILAPMHMTLTSSCSTH